MEHATNFLLAFHLQVKLVGKGWMVIDLEQVAEESRQLPPSYKLACWDDGTLKMGDGGGAQYTCLSDMYQLGRLLQSCACAMSANAQAFVEALLGKQLTADQALRQSWLQA